MIQRAYRRLCLGMLLVLLLGPAATPAAPTSAASIQDTPTGLVSGGVSSYTVASPRVIWHTGISFCPPGLVSTEAQIAAPETETLKRVATYGSPQRTLYAKQENCGQGKIADNMVADANFVYWATNATGLVKLSVNANPGDAPQTVDAGIIGNALSLAIDDTYIYSLRVPQGLGGVTRTNKSTGASTVLTFAGTNIRNIQVSHSFLIGVGAKDFVYWLDGNVLKRFDLNAGGAPIDLASGVVAYHADGGRTSCSLLGCTSSDSVFISLNGGNEVRVYNNRTNTLGASPIYTTSTTSDKVYGLVADASNLFMLQEFTGTCSGGPFCFPPLTDKVYRRGRGASGSTDLLYTAATSIYPQLSNLKTADGYLFWQENSAIQRLPNNAAALPQTNMRVTGIEVIQSVQNLNNSVVLIRGKRTFARVYVQSDGPAVSGVTAQLTAPALNQTLVPVNDTGTTITVRPSPNRDSINHSFLFELPWSWTQQSSLSLRATLNPYGAPPQASYANNQRSVSVNFSAPASLSVEFFRLNYTIGNTTYRPRISEDVLRTYSYILRAYPLGGSVGQNFKPRLWDVEGGTQLGNWVNQSDSKCATVYPKAADRSLCASYYTNGWLFYYRVASMFGLLNVGLSTKAFYYGMISDASGNFPRGQAVYDKTSVGPSGIPGSPFSLGSGWDTDGTYADWYAAHEIGHSLGRAHPNAGSDNPATANTSENCGHSRSDPSYPYGNTTTARAPIGPADNSMEGFDVGDPGLGIPRAVLPSSIWNDVMSYCSNQWLSDYTYKGMYDYMRANPSVAAETAANIAVDGDFLAVNGVITGETAGIALARRLSSVVNVPPLVAGGYSIRLLNAANAPLANYAFTPEESDDADALGFGQVVDFVAGTRTIQIVRLSDGKVLTSQPVSANPPAVSNVALPGAASPVSGNVTLAWSATDPDGDPLSFDISYSRDGGSTFQPVRMGVTGSSVGLDTAQLGGSGTAILRVTATDGTNSASADSAPFVMANKPPQPFILTPGATSSVQYGQLVNFSGLALDAQDGTVAESSLVWSRAGQPIGTGAQISVDDLPVGANVIVLTATNSAGQSATASVTVNVGDDLNLPGPTLSAGPGAVGWHVDAGAGAQTAQISIGNSGSGTLSWTASSNQPWLTLSAASGTVSADGDPATLTLTANPSALAAGRTYAAQLTLTRPATTDVPAQTVVIPVSISIGDIRENVVFIGVKTFMPKVYR